MKCFKTRSKTLPPTTTMSYSSTPPPFQSSHGNLESLQQNTNPKQEIILRVPRCAVHLMLEGEAIELDQGEFTLVKITENNIPLATIIKVGRDLQWPLTKDEPVVKLDSLHYLFSLPMRDGEDPLSYGVTFFEQSFGFLGTLDSFLKEHACFSDAGAASRKNNNLDWKEFAPRIGDYNNVLAKAIATGTGHIVRGIFICSNAYTNQVQKGGEMIQTRTVEAKNGVTSRENYNNRSRTNGARKKNGVNNGLKRVRKMSKTTEKLSKSMLDMVGVATGSVMAPLMKSQAGKAFFSMVPGEVVLASLDALNKVLDAAEAAEKQALSATSGAATRAVSHRFGESAGEATGEMLATAGHCANTAWNVFKIRKAITPSSTASNGVLRNADKMRNVKL